MELSHRTQGPILIVIPKGMNLDARETPFFKTQVVDLISNHAFQKVILDLQHLYMIDSSGIGSFLFVSRMLHTRGGELKLAQINKSVRTILELVSMNKIFEMFNSMEEAICSFNTPQAE
jgi:anti-sigma B factor antagonist/stage II sporulation protein AA (anti-sigma F factor antagonist)